MGRIVYVPINDKVWQQYYQEQARQIGHGLFGYQGTQFQRGNGLGSFFGRLFRAILPVAKSVGKSALKSVAKQAVNFGSNVIGDLSDGQPINQSLKKRSLQATQNLLKEADQKLNQSGQGLGKRKVVSKTVSVVPKKKRRVAKKKQPAKKKDIFH